MSEYDVDILTNGVRVVTVPMPHLHSVELVCYLAVGGRCETAEQSGLSHFLEHMVFRGTAEYPTSTELERAFEAIGGSVNASTDAETTCFHSRVHPQHVSEGVTLFASMLRRPCFNELETERRIILEEAREDYNENGDQINLDNLMVEMLWPGHPLGGSLVGSLESLHDIDQSMLEAYYHRWYHPDNLVVCACGPVDRDALVEVVKREFGDWSRVSKTPIPAAPEPHLPGPVTRWVHDSDSQMSLQLAFPLPGRHSRHTLAVRLLRRVLSWGGGARLSLRLREELGLTYAVEANCSMMDDTGYLAIDLSVAPENLVHSISELLGVLRDIREKEITADELAMVVKGYLFDLEFSRDQPEALAVRYGWGLQADYLRTFEQDIRELKELTPEYLQRVAREFIRLQGLKLVVVGPWTKDQRRAVEGVLKATPF